MDTFNLEIITPDGAVFSGDVEGCVLPGIEGLFGVLPKHSPMVVQLGSGEAKFTVAGKTEHLALSGGFAQVDPKKVTILAETAELAGQIDIQRAKAKVEQKTQALKETRLQDQQAALIEASLLKEIVRLKVAERKKHTGQ